MKKWIIAILILIFNALIIMYFYQQRTSAPSSPETAAPILPAGPGAPLLAGNDEIIEHSYYTLAYNEQHEQADWVFYKLEAEYLQVKSNERKDNFREDPFVSTGSAALKDYKGSGYDRGHLLPAADMSWSEAALSETFFMSNMSPQAPSFNRGIWKKLETQVRDWALQHDDLYVVTGPVLQQGLATIGENAVSVPPFYYKVILDYNPPEYKGIGFVMANEKLIGDLGTYAVTIDSVEVLTGIDFFYSLPDDFEAQVESSIDLVLWNLSE